MPSPQFAAPRPASRPRARRLFTLAQANQSLPLVKRVVADIVRCHQQVADLQAKSTSQVSQAAQDELERILVNLQSYLDELENIGCELKDYQTGLIDFVGRHQGRNVCLCWKLGEERIGFWHELDSGFAGRQPVTTLDEGK